MSEAIAPGATGATGAPGAAGEQKQRVTRSSMGVCQLIMNSVV